MSKQATLDFWFEFASPIPTCRSCASGLAAGQGNGALAPFLLGPVFLSLGWNDSPFNIYPPKGATCGATSNGCAPLWPAAAQTVGFPRNGLLAARVALLGQDKAWIAEFAKAVMSANFAEDRDISDSAVIGEILDLGLPADDLLAQAGSAGNKAALHGRPTRRANWGLRRADLRRRQGTVLGQRPPRDGARMGSRARLNADPGRALFVIQRT